MTALTDRMRTCAAHILANDAHERDDGAGRVLRDAADLLIEASNILDIPLPAGRQETIAETRAKLGEPMEIIEMKPIARSSVGHYLPDDHPASPMWVAPGDTLPVANPYRSAQSCPKCDSRTTKTVRRKGNMLMLICPVCSNEWQYQP